MLKLTREGKVHELQCSKATGNTRLESRCSLALTFLRKDISTTSQKKNISDKLKKF